MKKIVALLFICLISGMLFAQSENQSGYANFPWGTKIEEIQKKFYPLKNETEDEDKKSNETVYCYERDDNFMRFFRFFNDGLYWGRTVYENPDKATAEAIVKKIVNTYGTCDNSEKYTEDKYEGTEFYWYIAQDLTIVCDIRSYYNSYGRFSDSVILLTYVNPITNSQLHELLKQKAYDELEL